MTRFFAIAGRLSALALAGLVPAAVRSQVPLPESGISLPAAPSAVLLTQASAKQVQPAGSAFVFIAPSTFTGPGGLQVENAQPGVLAISLDDAVALGLKRNARLISDRANARAVQGFRYQVEDAVLPDLTLQAQSSTQEINLAAMGFRPGSISIPGFPTNFPTIVKVNTTQALVSTSQQLFNLPDFELLRAAKHEFEVVNLNTLNSRGELVLAVSTAYLQVLADQANLVNAQAQRTAAQTLLDQASAKRQAGVGTGLDELRARVEEQTREQDEVSAATKLSKDTIQLNRIMGVPAGQQLKLTDEIPFAELADMDAAHARAVAYDRRKDLLSLVAQVDVAERERRAVHFERYPTLAVNGFYGVLGETTGLYHGVFRAVGSLQFPIFREAAQRGEEQQISAQLMALRQRQADLRGAVDAQIRSALLDVQSASQMVGVARSSVELSEQELADERDRFAAGVDDNLPVVDAQASVASAQASLVQALYQFNVAKLQLARATGIIESSYRSYLR